MKLPILSVYLFSALEIGVRRDPCGNVVKPTDLDYADCAEVK